MSNFRFSSKQVFLTYPKCNTTKEELAEFLNTKGDAQRLIVAQEEHKDGTPHLHAYVKYAKPIHTRDCRFFDFKDHHPNIEAPRTPKAVLQYVTKDGNFIQQGIDVDQYKNAQASHKRVIGQKLIKGSITLTEAVEENPELLFGYKRLKADLDSFHRDKAEAKPTCKDTIPNTWEQDLPIVDGKQKHYWIWSHAPNKGKTTWLKGIAEKYRASWYNY